MKLKYISDVRYCRILNHRSVPAEADLVIHTTTSALTEHEEEVSTELIEDNGNQEKQLADSLEQVINNLSEIVDDNTEAAQVTAATNATKVDADGVDTTPDTDPDTLVADQLEDVINNLSEIVRGSRDQDEDDEPAASSTTARPVFFSLEEVMSNLNEIVEDSIATVGEPGSAETAEGGAETQTTTEMQPDDLSDVGQDQDSEGSQDSEGGEEGDSQDTGIVRDVITRQALARLQTAELTARDMSILTALLELETLKGEQKDTKAEIENKLSELELLLNANTSLTSGHEDRKELITLGDTLGTTDTTAASQQKPRRGKTISELATAGADIAEVTAQTVDLFENIQRQLFSLLAERHKFLQIVSQKINAELGILQQTVSFLQQLVSLKQGVVEPGLELLGEDNPLLQLLQSGSTSVFLTLTKFFQAVESVLGMRDQFLRIFSFDSSALQETRLLERIQELKLNQILPAKMRFLMNVHANSDKLGRMLEQIFSCVGQIVEAKVEVIESVGKFFENKINFLEGLSGPGTNAQEIVEAVQTGNLFELLNFGPFTQAGVPGMSDAELERTVEGLLAELSPEVPDTGPVRFPVKPLLVDHRILGLLSGRDRERFINRYLARRLARLVRGSSSELEVTRGRTVLQSSLPPLHLGSPCTNDIRLGRSRVEAVVTRSSRLAATTGLTLYSHAPTSLDLFGRARLHTTVAVTGHVSARFGHRVFGKCLAKFSGSSPISVSGRAVVEAAMKVVVRHARLETRVTRPGLVTDHVALLRGHVGEAQPHLVFNFDIKIDGTVTHFDVTKLKLSGCELQLLGIAPSCPSYYILSSLLQVSRCSPTARCCSP